ncbi:MAG: hypothetical protein WC867_04485 [Candidatus Pacearchaeota archaeon]|jgi:hypothetical protein
MRVSIEDTKYYYNYLDYMFEFSPEQSSFENNQGESWKEDYRAESDKQKSIKSIRYQAPPIELFYPLSKGHLILTRNFSHFSAFAVITSRVGESAFNNINDHMETFTKETGYIFSPTSDSLTGYIYDNENISRASIFESNSGGGCLGRDIGIGCNGAEPIEFTSLSEFAKALKGLENIINSFIKSVYYPLESTGSVKLPDITINYLYL